MKAAGMETATRTHAQGVSEMSIFVYINYLHILLMGIFEVSHLTHLSHVTHVAHATHGWRIFGPRGEAMTQPIYIEKLVVIAD